MTTKNTDPPTELLRELLSVTPEGQKIPVPNKRSDIVAMRERLFMSGRGTGKQFEYMDLLLDLEKQGRVEFLPEDS